MEDERAPIRTAGITPGPTQNPMLGNAREPIPHGQD